MSKLTLALVLLTSATAMAATPSSPPATSEDPFLRDLALTQRYSLGLPVRPVPTPDGKAVLFLRAEPRSPVNSIYRFDVATGETKKLLSPEDVLRGAEEKLSPAERAQRERTRQSGRGFVSFQLSDDGANLLTSLSGRLFLIRLADGDVRELPIKAAPVFNPRLSPDGKLVAFVHDRDLYAFEIRSQRERRLTHAADPAITNGMAEFIAEEELDRLEGFWWSPDSRQLAFEEADARGVDQLDLPDLAHPDEKPAPARYPRPGRPNVKVRVGLVTLAGGTPRWLSWDAAKLPYLVKVVWRDKAPLTLVLSSRDEKTEVVGVADARGQVRPLVTEHDDAFLEIDPSVPRWLPDGSAFVWSSAATGAPRLELHDADGKLVRALTQAGDGYAAVAQLDAARRRVWIMMKPTPPTAVTAWLSLDGGPATVIARETGAAPRPTAGTLPAFGHRGPAWVDSWRDAEGAPHNRVHVDAAEGDRVAGELPSVALSPPFATRQQLLQVGPRKLWAAVVRPRNFDRKRKYPVVVDVYAGPHAQQVRAAPPPTRQWIADHGVIVVAIDGRGTPARGNEFAHYIAGDFSRTLDDQVAGLQALGAQLPELDLGRVGIIGWSFGGYESALAVLLRPDVFHVAVAGAPVVDWRDYDTAYTERYLGTPEENPKGYAASSLLTYAPKLRRPLMIVHGTDDDNVYFLHSLKLMDALFRHGRTARFLPLQGYTHRVADPVVVEQLNQQTIGFLLETLLAPSAPKAVQP